MSFQIKISGIDENANKHMWIDIDNDGFICSYGELCEFYPESTSSQTTFVVDGSDTSGAEIYGSPSFRFGGVNAASISKEKAIDTKQYLRKESVAKILSIPSNKISTESKSIIPKNAIKILPN